MTSLPAPDRLLADAAWLRRLARQLTGNAELADDLQQDVTLAALAQPDPAAGGRSWLAAVARNLAVSLRRRTAVERRSVLALPPREPVPSPDALAAQAELQNRAVAALLALPAVYRNTVLLRFMQGLSLQATAVALGVPEETVRTRQKRALVMLRAKLAEARGDRRTAAALLTSLTAWGVAMKLKHVAIAAAFALVALLSTVPFWPRDGGVAPRSEPGAVVAAQADLGRTNEDAATAAASTAPMRTEVEVAVAEVSATPSTATLTMRITWQEDGAPASGIPVLCRRWTETGTFAVTDAAGEATFAELPPGDYEAGTHDLNDERVALVAGDHKTVEHQLSRARRVTGVVTDAAQAPVAGALILVSAAGTAPQFAFPVGRSDAQGRFDCRGLRNGAIVGASHPRHGSSEFRILLGEQGIHTPEAIVLRLSGASMGAQGRVVDEQGKPVTGAWVEFGRYSDQRRPDETGCLWQPAPATLGATDRDGRFAFDCLSAGECPVLIYHPGFAPHREVVTLTAAPASLLVTLHPGGVLSGTVRDAAGNAVVGADVDLEDYDFPRRCSQEIGSDGAFRLEDLPFGEIAATVIAPGFPRQQRTFTLTGSEEQRWDVVLRVEAAIRGRLVDHKGLPLAGWFIASCGSDRRAKTDAEGRFVIAECDPEGNVLIVRDKPGFVPERVRLPNVRPAELEQTFVVPADSAPSARLRGQCVGPDGTPLPDATLHLTQDNWPISLDSDRCSADGKFAIGPLPPGSYRVMPHHRQFVFASSAAEVKAGADHDLGVQRGALPARLVVRLLGEAAACARAKVELVGSPHGFRSDGDGVERTFVRVFPGRYRLFLRTGDRETDAGEVDLAPGAEAACEVTVR